MKKYLCFIIILMFVFYLNQKVYSQIRIQTTQDNLIIEVNSTSPPDILTNSTFSPEIYLQIYLDNNTLPKVPNSGQNKRQKSKTK